MAKLSGGVAVIKVGAATETEMKEIKHRIEDAVGATKAAVEEGVVPGGGVALLRASQVLENLNLPDEEMVAIGILRRALEEPIRTIAKNAGFEGAVVADEVKKHKGNFGFNAANGQYEDMVAAGVIDPTKVTRSALENAVSVAGMLLTTEALVTDLPKKEESHGMPGGGMGDVHWVRPWYTDRMFGYRVLISDGFTRFIPYALFVVFLVVFWKKIIEVSEQVRSWKAALFWGGVSSALLFAPSGLAPTANYIDIVFLEFTLVFLVDVGFLVTIFGKNFIKKLFSEIAIVILLLVPFTLAPLLIDNFWKYS